MTWYAVSARSFFARALPAVPVAPSNKICAAGNHDNLFLIHPAAFHAALAVQIGFNLDYSRNYMVVSNQVQKLVWFKIGDSDGTDFSIGVKCFQITPCGIIIGKGPVQEQQVDRPQQHRKQE